MLKLVSWFISVSFYDLLMSPLGIYFPSCISASLQDRVLIVPFGYAELVDGGCMHRGRPMGLFFVCFYCVCMAVCISQLPAVHGV